MMKILVLSDSHGGTQGLNMIIERNMDSQVIVFLGDGADDFADSMYLIPGIAGKKVVQVRGNCDWFSREPDFQIITVEGQDILCTHGNEQKVKRGYDELARFAAERGCSIALFGHTHLPHLSEKNGVTLFNPGAVHDGNYGVVMLGSNPDEKAEFNHFRL